jgi:hypothetical protein
VAFGAAGAVSLGAPAVRDLADVSVLQGLVFNLGWFFLISAPSSSSAPAMP